MVVLESCPKHNMVAYLEKTAGNAEFHEVIDFLARSSIYNALTVSLVVSTTFVEQFWMSAKSKIINNVRYINAKVDGRPVSISEASIRSDRLFDDADGIDSLPNQAIFDAIQLMGYEGDLTYLEPQYDPSPRPSPSTHIPDSIPEDSGGNHGGQSSSDKSLSGNEGDMTLQSVYDLCISLCTQVTDQAKKIKHLKAQIKKLKKKAKHVITHHKAWMKSERKSAKAGPLVHKDPLLDELPDDTLDYMDTKDAKDVGRTRDVVNEEKETADDKVSTEDALSTAQQKVSTDRPNVSTDRPKVNTDKEKDSTISPDEGTDDQTEGRSATPTTPTTTPTMFGDDETIAQVLLNMSQAKAVSREKEKGVELKDVEEPERPRPTLTRSLLTLKPLPKIDPKDKGKKKIEEEDESDTEFEGIPEAEKKFKQLARDEEMARKYDVIQARIEADRLLALRLQDEEREQFTMEERAKFLHETIAAQRRFLTEQRAIAIRNKPPTRTQFRNQMMTYLKHVGNKKHSDLKNKTFEEIQALYEKVKRFDESFTAVGSTKDERNIKEMNKGAKDLEQKRLKKKVAKETPKTEDTAKVPAKVDVTEQGTKKRKGGHMKMIARKRKRPQPDVNSDDEHRKCLKIVTFEGTIDSEIMEKKSFISKLDKVSSPEGDYLVIHRANGNFRAFNYLLEEKIVIMEYLVNISKRCAFWSLNEDILKITILKTNTPYPSRKIRRIRACTHQRPQRKQAQYALMSMNCPAYELYWSTLSRNMNPVVAKQVALDNSLVPSEKRLKIEKCNARIEFSKPQRKETYQVTLDALKLSPCYPAFLITAEVPEVNMHQFWNTIHKIKDTDAYRFKLDKKKFHVDTEVFMKFSRFVPNFSIKTLLNLLQKKNWCISGKTRSLDRPGESQAQILWGMYNKKNVDYVALLWEDFMYQVDNRETSSARKEHMPYPRFTKVIISHFISKYKTVSIRNIINLHTIHDDSLLDVKDSKAYKTYNGFATRKATPKKVRKFKKVASPSRKLSLDTPSESMPKKKTPAKVERGKGMDLLSDVALLEVIQLKKTLKKSKLETHKLHASGLVDGVISQPKVPDEQEDKTTGDSSDGERNDDDSDEVTKDDDEDDVKSDANDDKKAFYNALGYSTFHCDPNLGVLHPLPQLKKLDDAEPISGPKTIKSILRSKSTFKAKTLKGVIINEPSLALAKDNKSSSALNVNSAPAGKLKSVKIKVDPPLAIKERLIQEILNMHSKDVKLVVAQLIPQLITMILNGSKKCDIRKPIWFLDSGCSRHMTGVKSYLHNMRNNQDLKWCLKMTLHAQLKVMALSNVMFDEKRGTIFNSNKEIVMIAPRAFRVFNTRRQQTKETYHITFDESSDAIKFSKPSVDNINIAKNERYPPDEYLHPYEPS
ncbi:hypothetical protein Tco_0389756 [Tanacetum coccineum]